MGAAKRYPRFFRSLPRGGKPAALLAIGPTPSTTAAVGLDRAQLLKELFGTDDADPAKFCYQFAHEFAARAGRPDMADDLTQEFWLRLNDVTGQMTVGDARQMCRNHAIDVIYRTREEIRARKSVDEKRGGRFVSEDEPTPYSERAAALVDTGPTPEQTAQLAEFRARLTNIERRILDAGAAVNPDTTPTTDRTNDQRRRQIVARIAERLGLSAAEVMNVLQSIENKRKECLE